MTTPSDSKAVTPDEADAALRQYHSYENFIALHKSQLQKMELPESLWRQLHKKLYGQQVMRRDNRCVNALRLTGGTVRCDGFVRAAIR